MQGSLKVVKFYFEGKRVTTKFRWRSKGDTMSLESFNVKKIIKKKSQSTLLQEIKREDRVKVTNFDGLSNVCSTLNKKLYVQP